MRLNSEGIEEIRSYLLAQQEVLFRLPEGERISLDSELLDQLIFDQAVIYDDKDGFKKRILKYPVWLKKTYPISATKLLMKVDLSNVSFEDVCWDTDKVLGISRKSEYISCDLSGTNAKIDFSKSYDTKKNGSCVIQNADFSFLDLTDAHLEKIEHAYEVNFSGCIGDFNSLIMGNKRFTKCQFCDIDLSSCVISFDDFFGRFSCCDFRNTGLSIQKSPSIGKEHSKRILSEEIQAGRLDGCSVNGAYLLPAEEKEQLKIQMQDQYGEYKKMIKNRVSDAILKALDQKEGD